MNTTPHVYVPAARIGHTQLGPEDWHRQQQRQEPGVSRAKQTVDRLVADAALLPTTDAPDEVREARLAFDAAVALARNAIKEVGEAAAATREAHERDLTGATDALRQGKTAPALVRPKAQGLEEVALVRLAAAERLVAEAHRTLTDRARDSWQEWKQGIIAQGDRAHEQALAALEQMQAAWSIRAGAYTTALVLDQQIAGRYPDLPESRKVFAHLPDVGNNLQGPGASSVAEAFATIHERLRQPVAWREWAASDGLGSLVFVHPATGAPVRVPPGDAYSARALRAAGWLCESDDEDGGEEL